MLTTNFNDDHSYSGTALYAAIESGDIERVINITRDARCPQLDTVRKEGAEDNILIAAKDNLDIVKQLLAIYGDKFSLYQKEKALSTATLENNSLMIELLLPYCSIQPDEIYKIVEVIAIAAEEHDFNFIKLIFNRYITTSKSDESDLYELLESVLYDDGIDADVDTKLFLLEEYGHYLPAHKIEELLYDACTNEGEDETDNIAMFILENYHDDISNYRKEMAFSTACLSGKMNTIKFLSERFDEWISDEILNSCLYDVVRKGETRYLDVIEFLLDNFKNDISNNTKSKSFIRALRDDTLDIARLILKKLDTTQISVYAKNFAIIYFALNEEIDSLNCILEKYKDGISVEDIDIALKYASQNNYDAIVEYFLKKNIANLSTKDKLHLCDDAFIYRKLSVINIFLTEYDSEMLPRISENFLAALRSGLFDIAETILKHCSDKIADKTKRQALREPSVLTHPEVLDMLFYYDPRMGAHAAFDLIP